MKRKYLRDENADVPNTGNSRKKARSQPADIADEYEFDDTPDITPSKPRSARPKPNGTPKATADPAAEDAEQPTLDPTTPIKRGRGRPKGSKNLPKPDGTPTPKKTPKGKLLFSTPIKPLGPFRDAADTPSKLRNAADRSARRKSTRALIERTINGDGSSDEEDEEIARHIYDSDQEDEQDENDASQAADTQSEPPTVPATPSKRGRGRPKGSKNKPRSPSPPRDLPPHELYFTQNRASSLKTSSNTLAPLPLLDHTEYFSLLSSHRDPHASDLAFLHTLHTRSFPQWDFELAQSFALCLYGFGSKRGLLTSYAEHISLRSPGSKIVVVNGFNPRTTPRDILTAILSLLPSPPKNPGVQPAEILARVLTHLELSRRDITLLIHSLDAPALRRPAAQAILARLAAHPRISLVASADHPSFPLLWDASARAAFNFVFHDCTTFAAYDAEEVDVVEGVHQLLGRSGRRVGGREGVGFVLRSLPVNARGLFRLLVVEQLLQEGEEGVEYRALYQKAVEEFVCGDEVGFRSLLKEFHDHQMITSRKDALGTEILSVPFRREELEGILEDLTG